MEFLRAAFEFAFREALFECALHRYPNKIDKVHFLLKADFFKVNYEAAIRFQNDPKKDATQSDLYREEGNKRYAKKNYVTALECFNKSLCFAPDRSEQLAKAYANRSAVYFSLKIFDLSLKNIKMAREAGYPEKLHVKLDEREVKCLRELKKLEARPKHVATGWTPKICYPPHEKVPFIANCLKFQVNTKFGRHIVTKADLKVGDVIAVEQPFCVATLPEVRFIVCANCFRENDLDLIPCPKCNAAMFCSAECLTAANETFHSIECQIMDVLVASDELDARSNVTLRLFFLAMKSFKKVDRLMRFMDELENQEHNVFTVDYEASGNIDMFATTMKLLRYETSSMQPRPNDSIYFTAMITKILLNHTDFKVFFVSKEEIAFLEHFILYLYEITEYNDISGSAARKTEPEMDEPLTHTSDRTCIGIYPFLNLFNHSCAPNVKTVKHGIQNVMVVMKPIKSGEQLFNCYGFHYRDMPHHVRKRLIRETHQFSCSCIACVENYPMLSPIDLFRQFQFIDPMNHIQLCEDYKFDEIKRLIPKYRKFLTKNSKDFPRNHTGTAEEVLYALIKAVYTDAVPLAEKIRLRL